MPRFLYQPHHIEFIASCSGKMPAAEITKLINSAFGTSISEKALRSVAKRYGISVKHADSYRRELKYSEEQINWIKESYQDLPLPELTAAINKRYGLNETVGQVRAFLKNHKIKCGRTGKFESGHISHNKGKKGWQAGGASALTRFKKGDIPINTMPVGSEVIDVDGYRKVKVAEPNHWKFLHRHLWEQENGKIPPGMLIRFLDGDKSNCSISNLALIDRGAHAVMNKMRASDYSPEVQPAILTLAKLKVSASRRSKTNKESNYVDFNKTCR